MAKIKVASVEKFVKFIRARERHRKVKEEPDFGFSTHNPADPIISKFRFCNVRRNNDRVTKWIFVNYMDPWAANPDLWFALVVARLFNNEPTLEEIKPYVLPFKPAAMRRTLEERRDHGLKNFNAAYIVSTNGIAKDKILYLVEDVLPRMWANRKAVSKELANTDSLEVAHAVLCNQFGLASFMAAQVLADLKYADPRKWHDFHTFCASGPGSKRGLNRILGRELRDPWNEQEFRKTVVDLRDMVNARLTWDPTITAQDIQNCLCEYDKYRRVELGTGEPKQLYKPKEK